MFSTKKIIGWSIFAIVAIVLLCTFRVQRIDAGHVGIKVNMSGGDRGISKTEYVTGWVPYLTPFTRVFEFPVSQQHIDYDETQIVMKGGFVTTIKPSFNYSINGGSVADMFQNLRVGVKQMESGWLKNAIIGSVNDVANLYTVEQIFEHRAQFEADIVKECNKRVAKWFTVSQLRTNITPPQAIVQSINAKTKAIQDVQVAQNQQLVAEAEAQRKMANARGDSAEKVINALADAKSISLKQQALQQSPQYVELIKAERWDGKLPVYSIGGGTGTFLQLPKQ